MERQEKWHGNCSVILKHMEVGGNNFTIGAVEHFTDNALLMFM